MMIVKDMKKSDSVSLKPKHDARISLAWVERPNIPVEGIEKLVLHEIPDQAVDYLNTHRKGGHSNICSP